MPTVLDSFPDGISDSIREAYERKLEDSVKALEAFYGRSLIRPTIVFDLKGHTAGIAYGTDRVRLNPDLINDPRYAHDMLTDTLPHEIAHCISEQIHPHCKHHGWEWKQAMYALGLPPKVCHNYETKAARTRSKTPRPHEYHCLCESPHMLTNLLHKRIQSGREYRCRICKAKLIP